VFSYIQLFLKRYRDKLDETAHEFVSFAVDGVKRMQTLIHELLEFSRRGTRRKPFEPVTCESMVQESLLNLNASIGECNALITRDPLPTVMADDSQLVQLFQNLVFNAIKSRSHEAPRVHIGCGKDHIPTRLALT